MRIKCANHSTMTFRDNENEDEEVSNGMLPISNLMKLPVEPLLKGRKEGRKRGTRKVKPERQKTNRKSEKEIN